MELMERLNSLQSDLQFNAITQMIFMIAASCTHSQMLCNISVLLHCHYRVFHILCFIVYILYQPCAEMNFFSFSVVLFQICPKVRQVVYTIERDSPHSVYSIFRLMAPQIILLPFYYFGYLYFSLTKLF